MRHEPRRTCVACRAVRAKRELLRLVCRPDGVVVADWSARSPGRGAYVCRRDECTARLVKGGRLSQAFKRPAIINGELDVRSRR